MWGLTEDYSPGDSLSDSSEELLQRGGERGQHESDFGEGVGVIRHTSPQKVVASHEKQVSQLMILVLV